MNGHETVETHQTSPQSSGVCEIFSLTLDHLLQFITDSRTHNDTLVNSVDNSGDDVRDMV